MHLNFALAAMPNPGTRSRTPKMPKLDATLCRSRPAAPFRLALIVLSVIVGLPPGVSDARERGHHRHSHPKAAPHAKHGPRAKAKQARQQAPSPRLPAAKDKFAAIVVDANSGTTLYARNEHELRHPASITKVMTLYLLFEQIEKGSLRLDSPIRISPRAAAQPPTKLGLRPGATIIVEDAIKAIVTRSANDIALAVAEEIGGDEERFAALMTRKARALGMSRTYFANASGLPDDSQVTTAHDLTLLGRAIQDHFPRHYRYFATRTFQFGKTAIRSHNHLLDKVEGMDGIKTGYTRASGFNLLTSVKRRSQYIVAVVMGGSSAAGRDKIMAGLIESEIGKASTLRTAAMIPWPGGSDPLVPLPPASAPVRTVAQWAEPVARPEPRPEPKLPFVPVSLKPGLTVDSMATGTISAVPPQNRPRPAVVSGVPRPPADLTEREPGERSYRQASLDGSTARTLQTGGSDATATPSTMRELIHHVARDLPLRSAGLARIEPAGASAPNGAPNEIETRRPAIAQGSWMIQIGATPDQSKAQELLMKAQQESQKELASAQPFTEAVQKGSATLYRARFAGFEADTAELACKTLKRSGMACFTTRN
jgi:D-alanyl-D-alanine carboxypeptidase